MTVFEAIILGVIQGLTEFLPVSSSGHLELASYLFGIDEPNNLQFTIAVHAATVLSTIVVFAKELLRLFRGLFELRMNQETIFIINIVISMIPILFVGLFFHEQITGLFDSNLRLVGGMLIVTAALLTFSHYSKSGFRNITPKSAFLIGVAQAVAIFPGLSRSGSTISAGLLQGVKRKEVSKFSFLMVLVPILGMSFLELVKSDAGTDTVGGGAIAAGFIAAFLTGTLACRWMIRLVNKGKLIWFAVYCAVVGVAAIAIYYISPAV